MFQRLLFLIILLGGFVMHAGDVPEKTVILSPDRPSGTTLPFTGRIDRLPPGCAGVRVEARLSGPAQSDQTGEVVLQLHLSQRSVPETSGEAEGIHSAPVRLPAGGGRHLLESFAPVDPALPLFLKLERRADDPADTAKAPARLDALLVTPLPAPAPTWTVADGPGYNSWPVIQTLGDKLVCVYSRGKRHLVEEVNRGVCARISADGGRSWSEEILVHNTPDCGDVTIGKGSDADGGLLVWVRCVGEGKWYHELYHCADGRNFTRIAVPELDPMPMQITDIFAVPGRGLMALWFSGRYHDTPDHAWGTLVSADNGRTWKQHTVEANLGKFSWPTEPSAVYLGDGKILAIARSEDCGGTTENAQFQLESSDYGATWTKRRTNITDVYASTPSLILDPESGLLHCYYFQRGRGLLQRRTVRPEKILGRPLHWPEPETIALGSADFHHAGNVNAVAAGRRHFAAFYTGHETATSVVVAVVAVRKDEK
ncbi:MAG: glycoside hydrolase [Lentisphaeria bacterium]|nr:glycoside hydrolase [Lentisphaeria bacterium]